MNDQMNKLITTGKWINKTDENQQCLQGKYLQIWTAGDTLAPSRWWYLRALWEFLQHALPHRATSAEPPTINNCTSLYYLILSKCSCYYNCYLIKPLCTFNVRKVNLFLNNCVIISIPSNMQFLILWKLLID